MKHSVGCVINYCSNEVRFIKHVIDEALLFSNEIIVVICDHFFDGSEENEELLKRTFQAHPQVKFIVYPYLKELLFQKVYKKIGSTAFWHSLSRYIGFLYSNSDYLFFLDADEVAEGERVAKWLESFPYSQYTAMRFANYWYFRESKYRAKVFEDSILLIKKASLSIDAFLRRGERDALFNFAQGDKLRNICGITNNPLFHHYSWVRTKEEMLKKTSAWSHATDRNWKELINKEFQAPFSGRDFVHNYEFEEVIPFKIIDLYSTLQPANDKEFSNVKKISRKELLKIIYPNFFKYLLKTIGLIDHSKSCTGSSTG